MLSASSLESLTANPAVRRLMQVLRDGGGEARVVGGAVRDCLLGCAVGEIDFAATLPPEQTSALLATNGIKAVPTGIEFGTITAVIDGTGYEITTLRHDVETDGRRAKVAFTDDWQGDAARRDFTMNALYIDGEGKLYDYFNGQDDLAAGRVRFIGDARARIREDVLRILRFFRFSAWFDKGSMDADGLAACRELAELVPQLSVERIWREIVKWLTAENPAPSWRVMLEAGILAGIVPEACDVARLETLVAIEAKHEVPASALRRFAALLEISGIDSDLRTIASLSQRLKLSKREAARLAQLATLPALLPSKLDPVPFRRALYEHGAEDARDAALLCKAAHPESEIESALAEAAQWQRPTFPLQGQDLLKLGMAAGPAMGALLRMIEETWMAADFHLTRDECLALAKKNC